jgi:hypothetical protein
MPEFLLGLDTESMEAKSVDPLPMVEGWQFEPKWNGFRCLVFKAGKDVDLRAKSGKSLSRYSPEMVEAIRSAKADRFDGEAGGPQRHAWVHRRCAGRAEPLEHRTVGCLAAASNGARRGSQLRSGDRRSLPTWHDAAAVAPRQGTAAMHAGTAAAGAATGSRH